MATQQALAHLVFLRSGGMLLVKKPQADWRQLQNEYGDYMTSLGPWSEAQILGYFPLDYGQDDAGWPFRRRAITEFMRSSDSLVLESNKVGR